MTKADKRLLIIIFIVSLFTYALIQLYFNHAPSKGQVIVKSKGEIVKYIHLQNDENVQRLEIEGKVGLSIIEIKDGMVRMVESTCPEKICIKQGWIKNPGQSIVCVPNEVVVYIDNEELPDAITR
ncbi:MAG: NusG domain II-containing protein [Clostridia bacterium]|nr:NusG domain II-containing protein [Clostridia bacterium]MDD4048340.1 NusG domain II-containing protein [Clostridia bacterium]